MKKNVVIFSALLLLGTAFTIVASKYDLFSVREKEMINQSFSNITNENDYIAVGETFVITNERFDFFKNNTKIMAELSGSKLQQTDKQLLDILLTKELTVQEAKNIGLIVTDIEIGEFIKQQKELFYNSSNDVENKDLISQMFKKRIKASGMTEDEFWNSDIVRNDYEKVLYQDKLFGYLIQNNKVENMEDFVKYQNKLLKNGKKSVKILLK